MKAFGSPVKIAALEFCSVFYKWRCGVNIERAVTRDDWEVVLQPRRIVLGDAGGSCVSAGGGRGVWIGLGCGDLEVKPPGTLPESHL